MPLTPLPPDLAPEVFALDTRRLLDSATPDIAITYDGQTLRAYAVSDLSAKPAAILAFDKLFDLRLAAATRLWRAIAGRSIGPNPASLSKTRSARLVATLRALDGHLDDASYREIAGGLFGADAIPDRAWKTHDLRDRTIRLVRSGVGMMLGGYRQLLLYPHRQRI